MTSVQNEKTLQTHSTDTPTITQTGASAMPRRVDAASLREWSSRAGGRPRVLDVRSPAEFESAHIPGSYNVPLDILREHREELRAHLDEPVVLVCRSGVRSQQAEQSLAEIGMPNLHVLEGGVTAWEGTGAPVVRGRQRWDLERQVRLVAGSLVLAGVVGSVAVPGLKWVAGFVGGGLTFAALSNTCMMGNLLAKLPYNRASAPDPADLVRQLKDGNADGDA